MFELHLKKHFYEINLPNKEALVLFYAQTGEADTLVVAQDTRA